jgi:hypothetical protein
MSADNLAGASGASGGQAEQADIIDNLGPKRIVGVKGTFGIGYREAGAIAHVLPGVANIVKQGSLDVLLTGTTQHCPNQPAHGPQCVGRVPTRCPDRHDGKPSANFEGFANAFDVPGASSD